MLNFRLSISFCLLILIAAFPVSAQQSLIIKGIVADESTHQPILGASVSTAEGHGTLTDNQGRFSLTVGGLPVTLRINFLGYDGKKLTLATAEGIADTFYLRPTALSLNQVVVTASRQSQKLEEVTQSVEVIKPDFLAHTQTTEIQQAVEKLPGVQVQKDQVTIRGISGFSYGAGSRVMVLLDDMPMLSADAGDAKWSYYPVENLQQVEVVKGAASALYGSSALEGIIHLRTALAADTPYTMVRLFGGFYDKPERKETAYWHGKAPARYGFTLAHRQSFGPLKVTASLFGTGDEGYRQGDNEKLVRGNLYMQYTPPKNNKLVFGFALNGMYDKGQNFLFFGDVAQPYLPYPGTVSDYTNSRWNSDISLKYYPSDGQRHIVRSRLFNTINQNNTGQSSTGRLLFNEYQYQKVLFKEKNIQSTLTTGANYILTLVDGGAIYGNHQGHNLAGYVQLDQKINRLTFSLGSRFETYKLDSFKWDYFPVFRTGLNLQVSKGGFLRYSLGQGFRYPSVAERFTSTSAGAIKIFPNPALQPESGWSTELAYRQIVAKGKWKAYGDAALFWAEYRDMIEYVFGFYPPPHYDPTQALNYVGFAAQNIPQTRIQGIELSTAVEYSGRKLNVVFNGGYTYMIPLNQQYAGKDTLERLHYLKYRRQHLVRANLDVNYGKFTAGAYWLYNSSFRNIDDFFLDVIKGLKANDYWMSYSSGSVLDVRAGIKLKKYVEVDAFAKNLLNKEYMEVPGNTNAPRNFMLQLTAQF